MQSKPTKTKQTDEILTFILEKVELYPTNIASETAKKFGISRQAVHKHLQRLISNQQLTAKGSTRKTYVLGPHILKNKIYKLSKRLAEDELWDKDFKPILQDLPKNIFDICYYGFTEIVNNAIDHSQGKELFINIRKSEYEVSIMIEDDGEGIFKKIKRELGLTDERLAIFELSKGKLTTDPKHHTGEGIFFSSRAFDIFFITSGSLEFIHLKYDTKDKLKDIPKHYHTNGTNVYMVIYMNSKKVLQKIFDEYASQEDDYNFNRTLVSVKLIQYKDEGLISRSQAKRLLARLDQFKYITLDFDEIDSIGPAFADEIFRVFANKHPIIELNWINANKFVEKMIRRALTHT